MKYIRFLPAIIWMLFIFYLSSVPTSGVGPSGFWRFIFFKSLHLIEYAILFLLIRFAGFSNKYSLLLSYIYAVSDEVHQYFVVGRSGMFRDTLFDLTGAFLAYIFLLLTSVRSKSKII